MKHGCYIKHNQIIPLCKGGQGVEKSRKIGSFVMNIMGLTISSYWWCTNKKDLVVLEHGNQVSIFGATPMLQHGWSEIFLKIGWFHGRTPNVFVNQSPGEHFWAIKLAFAPAPSQGWPLLKSVDECQSKSHASRPSGGGVGCATLCIFWITGHVRGISFCYQIIIYLVYLWIWSFSPLIKI